MTLATTLRPVRSRRWWTELTLKRAALGLLGRVRVGTILAMAQPRWSSSSSGQPAVASVLKGAVLGFPGFAGLTVRRPTHHDLDAVDSDWPPLRKETLGWSWTSIGGRHSDLFAVVDSSRREVVALWCGKYSKSISLPDIGAAYRLDYLEVAPDAQQCGLGYLTLCLAALRAHELSATAIVLGSVPGDAEDFYLGVGGQSVGKIKGWKVERGLVPFVFGSTILKNMAGYADAFFEDEG